MTKIQMSTESETLVLAYLLSGGSITKPRRAKKAKGLRHFNVSRRSKKIGKVNFHGQRY
jgi:hypothetical protein